MLIIQTPAWPVFVPGYNGKWVEKAEPVPRDCSTLVEVYIRRQYDVGNLLSLPPDPLGPQAR